MNESEKLRSLREVRAAIVARKLTDSQMKRTVIADTDGRHVRLEDPDILAVIDRRIAAEEAGE